MSGTAHGILAGFDGSPDSEHALTWAAREARSRGVLLTVCHAWEPGYPAPPSDTEAFGPARRYGDRILADGMRRARASMGQGEVRPLLAAGAPARVLCERSRAADMVVLGSCGQCRLAGALVGPVSSQVAAHAAGRVVVVRGHWRPAAGYLPGAIVVGADGSAASRAAMVFGFEEAQLREVPLVAVCALADAAGSFGSARRLQEDAEHEVGELEKEYPEVAVHRQIADGPARTVLLTAAYDAQMLIVGARGRGGVHGMPLGSVSQAVLHHAPCPVSVVHV